MKTLVCTEFDTTDTTLCVNEVWVDEPSLLPELTAEDGALIGVGLFGLMATAYLLKTLFRNARNS